MPGGPVPSMLPIEGLGDNGAGFFTPTAPACSRSPIPSAPAFGPCPKVASQIGWTVSRVNFRRSVAGLKG